MEQCGTRRLWQGLWTITDYRGRTPSTVSTDASVADELNSFYAPFEASTVSGTIAELSSIARDEHTLSVTEHNVRKALMRVNTRKAAGPDVISGRRLKTCANQLAPVFTTIFWRVRGPSLLQVVHYCPCAQYCLSSMPESVPTRPSVERVSSYRYLGVHIIEDLTWTTHIGT